MCTKHNGHMNKKILLLTVVVLICFLSSCFSGLQDWDKDIINGYSLIRINDGVIVIGFINGTSAVDEYVDQYCYNDIYIGAKRIPIPEGVHMTYEEICQLETITYEYYLINTMTAQVHGPLTEEEYVDLCEEIDIEMCDWISTHSLEKYVKRTGNDSGNALDGSMG